MERLRLALICIMSFSPGLLWCQVSMPPYQDVVKEFFSNYSYEPEENFDRIYFAKKKQGWFVDIVDLSDHDKLKQEQLFWNAETNKYNLLSGFGPGYSKEETDEKVDSMLTDNDSHLLYGYARCRYFGYADWARDMIKDYGDAVPQNDTLLEGLARAYINYSFKFLWDFSEFNSENPSIKKLGRLEMPGKDRIDSFNYHTNKAVDCYKLLNRRNPDYKTLIGNPGMKIIYERMNQYLQLNMSGYSGEAKNIMDGGQPANDSTTLQIGYAYLNSCPPNSILITFGDGDTYPLWYLQQKKGYRKDVTVINNSLLSVAPYIHMLKRDNILNFSTDVSFYGKDGYDYFQYDETGPPNITSLPMPEFIRDIQQAKHFLEYDKTKTPAYQVQTIKFKVDIPLLKKVCNQNNLVANIDIKLNKYLFLSDVITLDIINSNLYSRPVCFTSNQTFFDKKFLQQEGLVYRFLPINEKLTASNMASEVSKIENYLGKNPSPVFIAGGDPPNSYTDVLFGAHENLYTKLITYYADLKNLKKKEEWASKYMDAYHPDKMNYGFSDYPIAEALLQTSFAGQATGMIEKIAAAILANCKNFQPPGYYFSKKTCLQYLEYLNSLLEKNNQSSEKLETMISEFSGEDEE